MQNSRQGGEGRSVDWRRYAALATGALGWRPAEFWRATPPEFFLALEGTGAPASLMNGSLANSPLAAKELQELLDAFPDKRATPIDD